MNTTPLTLFIALNVFPVFFVFGEDAAFTNCDRLPAISDISISTEDKDGDGYSRFIRLTIQAKHHAGGSYAVVVKPYVWINQEWGYFWAANDLGILITNGFNEVSFSIPYSYLPATELDYAIAIFRNGVLCRWADRSSHPVLQGIKVEGASYDVVQRASVGADLFNAIDNDGDTYSSASSLTWRCAVTDDPGHGEPSNSANSLLVYEKIFRTNVDTSHTELLYTAQPYTIRGGYNPTFTYNIPHPAQGRYRYSVVVYRVGQTVADGSSVTHIQLHETPEEDLLPDSTAVITDAWFSGEVDEDGDGFTQRSLLFWNPDVVSATSSLWITEKIYRANHGSPDYSLIRETSLREIYGHGTNDIQSIIIADSPRGEYDYKIEIFSAGKGRLDHVLKPNNYGVLLAGHDDDLSNRKEERITEDEPEVIIAPYSAVFRYENDWDGDGFPSSFKMSWSPYVVDFSSSFSIFEKIYRKPTSANVYNLIHTTSPRTISGYSWYNDVWVDIMGATKDIYDYKIELYINGNYNPEYVYKLDSFNKTHAEETASEDDRIIFNDAWVSDRFDNDRDGYPSSFKLNWNPKPAYYDTSSFPVYEKIYRRAIGEQVYSIVATTEIYTIKRNAGGLFTNRQYEVKGNSRGIYDYLIEVYRENQDVPDDLLAYDSKILIQGQKEETSLEDVFTPVIGLSKYFISAVASNNDNPSNVFFTIKNEGNGELRYAISNITTTSWLTITPLSGTSTGESDVITINYNARSLEPGVYSATMAVISDALTNNYKELSFELTVRARGATMNDFDGDGVTDIGIFRPSQVTWYVFQSTRGPMEPFQFGTLGDLPVAADYDGDGISDLAIFRPSTVSWYIFGSSAGPRPVFQFGTIGDRPVPADYDGDGIADLAIYRPSTMQWFVFGSAVGPMAPFVFGAPSDIPVPADYDGDGRADLAVFRPSVATWYIFGSSTGPMPPFVFGAPGDIPVPGDYDGDGIVDKAIFRPSSVTWLIFGSAAGPMSPFQFGTVGDLPVR